VVSQLLPSWLKYYQLHLEVVSVALSVGWTILAQSYVLGMWQNEARSLMKEARLPSRERVSVWAHDKAKQPGQRP